MLVQSTSQPLSGIVSCCRVIPSRLCLLAPVFLIETSRKSCFIKGPFIPLLIV